MCLLAFADRAYFVSRQMVKPFREPFHGQSRQLVEIDIPALTLFSNAIAQMDIPPEGMPSTRFMEPS